MQKDIVCKNWSKQLEDAAKFLPNLSGINSAASGFNANIDAVIQLTGKALSTEIAACEEFVFCPENKNRNADTLCDVLTGMAKCFINGIAEERTTGNAQICTLLQQKFVPQKMQMGGQGGIIANLLSLCSIKKVVVHTNSLPQLQANCFLPNDNLEGFDERGRLMPAYKITRPNDTPLIHLIFEFKKGDCLHIGEKSFVCPKSNRFIVSCDKMNQNMVLDKPFIDYMNTVHQDYFFLSGFHMLCEDKAKTILPQMKNLILSLKNGAQKNSIFHLEIASTPSAFARKAIVDEIAKNVDSIGLNEREASDIMEVINPEFKPNINSVDMFKSALFLKNYTGVCRIELHMLGLFLTIQDKNWKISAQKAKDGMLLAARIGSSRATLGDLTSKNDLLFSQNFEVSQVGYDELKNLADFLNSEKLLNDGLFEGKYFDLIAVPTMLETKPKSLVGMGDTISAISLLGAKE